MMNLLITASLLLAPGLCAAPAEDAGVSMPPGVSAAQREMAPLVEELEPLRKRLESLSAQYAEAKELRSIEAERDGMRRKLQEGAEKLEKLNKAYGGLLMGVLLAEVQQSMSNRKPEDLKAKLGGAMTAQQALARTNTLARNISIGLKDDQVKFEKTQEALKKKRLRRNAALFVSAILLTVISAAYALVRRSAPQAPASPLPGSVPPALGASAGLSVPTIPGPPPPPAEIAAEGKVLGGNFQLVRELGRGGMGVVWEAVDLTLRRTVAIKQMREELYQSPRELELFLDEARVVAELKHPDIVEIHGMVREEARVFLVFEYVSGRALSRLLEESRLPLRSVKGVLARVASALDYAHSKRVIHRDLKPANIMITEQHGVKVMDFGLAHRAKLSAARLTQAKIQGTPAYMAPEQELGSVSKESDLYSLGVCLYEMATGKLPFSGPNFLAQKQELFFVRPSQAGLPAALDAVIERALQPEPSRRFHSAAELTAALGAVADA